MSVGVRETVPHGAADVPGTAPRTSTRAPAGATPPHVTEPEQR